MVSSVGLPVKSVVVPLHFLPSLKVPVYVSFVFYLSFLWRVYVQGKIFAGGLIRPIQDIVYEVAVFVFLF